jgi:hypothetical protein
VSRLVRIKNINDKAWSEKLHQLEPHDCARLGDFREWCLNTGICNWKGSEKDLQELTIDLDQSSYLSDIYEIDLYGHHKESDIWFFGDAGFVETKTEGIKRIEADENNIFWHGGIGYQIDPSIDKRGSTFGQGAPMMMWGDKASPTIEEVRKIYIQFLQDMHDTIGGYEGWLALGIMLAYAISPELLRIEGGHPGLWMYGKMSGGKTTVARWLMRIWGFAELHGISIAEGTTHVAVTRFLGQYSCIPFWFDEFRKDQVDPDKVSTIRYAYDRGGTGKGIATNDKRTRMAVGLTTPLITGETGSTDAATRSRYVQVQVAINNRIGDSRVRFDRIQETDCKSFYKIGRYIMEHRREFEDLAIGTLKDWMVNEEVKKAIPNPRVRFVHGVAYATIEAMDNLLITKEQRMTPYLEFIKAHGAQSLLDVMDETFISTFWRDLAHGLQTKKVSKKFFAVTRVTTGEHGMLKEEKDSENGRWVLYIAPVAYNEYSADKRSRNENVPLDMNSLQREMSRESYFIPLPRGRGCSNRVHRKRIEGVAYNTCWVLSLEDKNGRTALPLLEQIIPHVGAEEDDLRCLSNLGILAKDMGPEDLPVTT